MALRLRIGASFRAVFTCSCREKRKIMKLRCGKQLTIPAISQKKIGLKLLPSIVVHHPTFGLIPLWIWNNMWTAQQILKFGGSIGLWK